MNYLAHAYLSFNHHEILVGNMISDFVKGKKKFDYPSDILAGIHLHRAIDQFTDAHVSTKHAASILKPAAGPYAGAFVDVVYDHFLANDKSQFADEESLYSFSTNTYMVLQKNLQYMPDKFAAMFPYMQSQNWLYNYRLLWGTEKSFGGLVNRAKYINSSKEPFQSFIDNYEALQQCYNTFFIDIKSFAEHTLKQSLNTL